MDRSCRLSARRHFARSAKAGLVTSRRSLVATASQPLWSSRGHMKGWRSWQDATVLMILCPACGADRLIPLTFPVYRRNAGPEVRYRRPMAKCSGCGERVFAHVVARPAHTADLNVFEEG